MPYPAITVIGPIPDQTYRLGPGKTRRQRGLDQPGLVRLSTGHQHRQRHPTPVGYCHAFASFASFGQEPTHVLPF